MKLDSSDFPLSFVAHQFSIKRKPPYTNPNIKISYKQFNQSQIVKCRSYLIFERKKEKVK